MKDLPELLAQSLFNLLIAMAASSLLFALIHLTNNGALLGILIPHFVAGMLFCAVYIVGGFSMAIAVHFGHNLLLIILLIMAQ